MKNISGNQRVSTGTGAQRQTGAGASRSKGIHPPGVSVVLPEAHDLYRLCEQKDFFRHSVLLDCRRGNNEGAIATY